MLTVQHQKSIVDLEARLFIANKHLNNTNRDVHLLNASNAELNLQLGFCDKQFTEMTNEIADFKTGDADDDKLPDCLSNLHDATHTLDKCGMVNMYLNGKVDHLNEWKEEVDKEVKLDCCKLVYF